MSVATPVPPVPSAPPVTDTPDPAGATPPPRGDEAAAATCVEVAIYHVHAEQAAAFPTLQAELHAQLGALPGFRGGRRLRGLDDPALFADYIWWDTRAAAEHAAAVMQDLPGGRPFIAAIAAVHTFAHLPASAPPPVANA